MFDEPRVCSGEVRGLSWPWVCQEGCRGAAGERGGRWPVAGGALLRWWVVLFRLTLIMRPALEARSVGLVRARIGEREAGHQTQTDVARDGRVTVSTVSAGLPDPVTGGVAPVGVRDSSDPAVGLPGLLIADHRVGDLVRAVRYGTHDDAAGLAAGAEFGAVAAAGGFLVPQAHAQVDECDA